MYAKGMTTSDIEAHIQDIYGVEVSDTTVSRSYPSQKNGSRGLWKASTRSFFSMPRHLPSAVSGRNGVVIHIETNSTESVHPAGDTLTGVKGIPGQRIQPLPLLGEHLTHRGFFAANLVGQVVQTLFLEHSVQIFHGFRFGNRNADIAANITH